MEVQADIERKDLVALSLYLFPRHRSNWILLGVLIIGIFVFIMVLRKPTSTYNIGAAAFASVVGGLGGLLAGYAFSLLRMLLTLGRRSGVLGKHDYSLTEEGLREVTEVNDSLQKWNGIQDIIALPRYIFFRINGYLFHVIPRRAFASEEQFYAFTEKARALREAA